MAVDTPMDVHWLRDHSDPFGFGDVNVPGDIEYVEFVLSERYSLSRFVKESRETGIPLETIIKREWENDRKGKDHKALSREKQGEGAEDIQESQGGG